MNPRRPRNRCAVFSRVMLGVRQSKQGAMVNDELARLIDQLDQSKEKTSEHSISSKINKVTEEDQSVEAIAERLAALH